MYAVPDLENSMAEIASTTGIVPSDGGVHPGNGTRNALLGLSKSSYLEIIGPDKKQSLENTLGELLVSKNTSGIRAWAVAVSDLASVADVAQELDFRVRDRKEMSRKTPEGSLLEWELLFLEDALLPFLLIGRAPSTLREKRHPVVVFQNCRLVLRSQKFIRSF